MAFDAITVWIEKQDDYTLQRNARQRFARNPYTVTNVMDMWPCDLMVVPASAKYNDNHRYIISVTDVSSKCLHMVPAKTKSGQSVDSALRSTFDDSK